MNEYVKHKQNGYLFNSRPFGHPAKRGLRLAKKLTGVRANPYTLTEDQNWAEISQLDWRSIGSQARQDHVRGYDKWQESLDNYAKFLTSS
jgi:hypothetical protein